MSISNGYGSLAEMRVLLGSGTATTHDADIERAVEAASRRIDAWCGRRFYQDASTSARTYTPEHPQILMVDDISTLTGLTVAEETVFGTWGQAWTKDDWTGSYGFRVEPTDLPHWRLVALAGEWPQSRFSVQVTAKWGFATVPTDIEQACYLLATRIYKRKDTPFGILDNPTAGGIPLPSVDPDVRSLLAGGGRI